SRSVSPMPAPPTGSMSCSGSLPAAAQPGTAAAATRSAAHRRLRNRVEPRGLEPRLLARSIVTLDAIGDFLSCLAGSHPALDLHPLAGLEVLVVLEEMRDLRPGHVGHVAIGLYRTVQAAQLVHRHGEDLGVFARLVAHAQH